ncbi:hypothetical protein EHS39_04270 [Ensifer sp. MPMI2T]|nr:hypothetical protein EHS39_04270 [Ensifer sp. MPMI2T]
MAKKAAKPHNETWPPFQTMTPVAASQASAESLYQKTSNSPLLPVAAFLKELGKLRGSAKEHSVRN